MTQAECYATAPQGNVTQTSHKYVTRQNPPFPTQPTLKNCGEAGRA